MKTIKLSCIIFLLLGSCQPNILDHTVQTIELEYISLPCACAHWAMLSDIKRWEDSSYKLAGHCLFIEPAGTSLELPDTLGYPADKIRVTGQFYLREGYPRQYLTSEEQLDKARIFRYTKYEVIRSAYRSSVLANLNPPR